MRIHSIQLAGYCGVSPDCPLSLQDFGHRNVFIGPNNAGKSTPLRFLEWVADFCRRGSDPLVELNANNYSPHWWHNGLTEAAISGTIKLSHLPPTFNLHRWDHDLRLLDDRGLAQIVVSVTPLRKVWQLCITPAIWNGSDWQPCVRPTDDGPSKPLRLRSKGYSQDESDAVPWAQACYELRELFSESVVRLQAIRSIDHDSVEDELGLHTKSLLEDLHEWSQDPRRLPAWDRFQKRVTTQLNELLGTGHHILRIKTVGQPVVRNNLAGRQNPATRLQLALEEDAGSLPLANLGSGIADAIVLLAAMERNPSAVFLLDEPECHLHPAMLRRLMLMLGRKEAQVVLTTHSSVLLDALGSNDRAYRFWKDSGECRAEPASSPLLLHDVLDDLGLANSSLLQPNCVLWVEGPSDRLYVNEWLRSAKPALREGVDYIFLYYGGRLLSHYSLGVAATGEDDFVKMVRVCRYAFVLMDRDTSSSDSSDLTGTKLRVLSEGSSNTRCLAVTTTGREIENDVPDEVLRRAFSSLLKVDASELADLSITGTVRYPDEVEAFLRLRGQSINVAPLRSKMSVARAILDVLRSENASLPPPPFLPLLLDLLDRAGRT